jgi:hypothetical protein
VKDGKALLPLDVHVPEFGAKLALTPVGNPEITLSVPFTVPLLPRDGTTLYVAEPPVPEVIVPVWAPTETELILGPSVKTPFTEIADVSPTAV